jgi:hypothetical protein
MSEETDSFGVNALKIAKAVGFGLNKSARLDNQRQPEQYSLRFELLLNPTFPYRLIPLNLQDLIDTSSENSTIL